MITESERVQLIVQEKLPNMIHNVNNAARFIEEEAGTEVGGVGTIIAIFFGKRVRANAHAQTMKMIKESPLDVVCGVFNVVHMERSKDNTIHVQRIGDVCREFLKDQTRIETTCRDNTQALMEEELQMIGVKYRKLECNLEAFKLDTIAKAIKLQELEAKVNLVICVIEEDRRQIEEIEVLIKGRQTGTVQGGGDLMDTDDEL